MRPAAGAACSAACTWAHPLTPKHGAQPDQGKCRHGPKPHGAQHDDGHAGHGWPPPPRGSWRTIWGASWRAADTQAAARQRAGQPAQPPVHPHHAQDGAVRPPLRRSTGIPALQPGGVVSDLRQHVCICCLRMMRQCQFRALSQQELCEWPQRAGSCARGCRQQALALQQLSGCVACSDARLFWCPAWHSLSHAASHKSSCDAAA